MLSVIIPSKFESELIKVPHHVSGMGKIRAVCAVHKLVEEGTVGILLAGFCGGIKNVSIGEVIKPTYFLEGDYNVSPLEVYPNLIGFGNCLMISQDRFITSSTYNFECEKIATDMESYAVAYTCLRLGVEFKVVKIVSDIVGENSEKDFLESCKKLSGKLEEEILNAI